MPSSATSMTVAGILFPAAEDEDAATEVVDVVVVAAVAALCSDVILISDLTFSSLWSMSNRDALGLIPFPALVMTSARVGHLEAAGSPMVGWDFFKMGRSIAVCLVVGRPFATKAIKAKMNTKW